MPVVRTVLISVGVIAVVAVLVFVVVAVTVATSITEDQVRMWFEAVGGVVSAAAAIVVAFLGFRSQRLQALDAAESQMRAQEMARMQGMEQQHAQSEATQRILLTERLWRERRPVYATILANLDLDNPRLANDTEFTADLEAVGTREINSAVDKWVEAWKLLKTPSNRRPPGAPAEEDLVRQLDEAADFLRDLVRRELGADVPLTNPQEKN